jgi:NDP-sugar pyrophosphorylase family protein
MLDISAVLLAGGLGKRIQHLFPNIPKPMIRIAGLPVAEWIIRLWVKQGIQSFFLSTGYLAYTLEEYFNTVHLDGVRITTVREPTPLGTGGALAFVLSQHNLSDPFLAGNADSIASVDIKAGMELMNDHNADALVFSAFKEDSEQFGTIQANEAGQVIGFLEKKPGPGIVNTGVYLLRKRFFERLPKQTPLSLERDIFPESLAQGARLFATSIQGDFVDIGTPAGYAAAEKFVQSRFTTMLQ